MRLYLGPRVAHTRREKLLAEWPEKTTHHVALGTTPTTTDDPEVVADCLTREAQPLSPVVAHGAMDAAGPVDGANGRAAHKVLGNRYAISTAPTAETETLSTDLNGTEDLQILCPPLGVAGFQTFLTGRVWTFGDTLAPLAGLPGRSPDHVHRDQAQEVAYPALFAATA